jgi:hypothetical protein
LHAGCHAPARPLAPSKIKESLIHMRERMMARCHNPKSPRYKNYGGRGIFVHRVWRDDPDEFYAWAVANGYQPGLQIDRIDNDGPYAPDNCRFVTNAVNQLNKRNNYRVGWRGQNLTLSEWCRKTGVPKTTIKERLRKKWPLHLVFDPTDRRFIGKRRCDCPRGNLR